MPKPKRIDVSLLERDRHVAREELRDRFYKLRDLEIQNLWQRASIFAGFIGLFFTGYGYILVEKLGGIPTPKDYFFHLICCGIAVLAIIFSVIWIVMAKGAKAWIEVHERYITELEAEEILKIPLRYQMGKLPYPGSDNEPSNCIFTTEGGRFSPSKLNIIFGQVLLVAWLIILTFHVFKLNPFGWTEPKDEMCIAIGLIAFGLISSCLILCKAKSGAILNRHEYLAERRNLLHTEIVALQKIQGDLFPKNSILSDFIDRAYIDITNLSQEAVEKLEKDIVECEQQLNELRSKIEKQEEEDNPPNTSPNPICRFIKSVAKILQ